MVWRPARSWTSCAPRGGYRHFELITQGGRGDRRWVELAAVLDSAHRERVAWSELQNRRLWSSGWQSIPSDDADSAAE
ncbi:MAG: TIGR02450 family Trp-rich protein [Synechococcus sp.]|nr:TIGR02450 family Trp-rich protein [Synechococcus sp.]